MNEWTPVMLINWWRLICDRTVVNSLSSPGFRNVDLIFFISRIATSTFCFVRHPTLELMNSVAVWLLVTEWRGQVGLNLNGPWVIVQSTVHTPDPACQGLQSGPQCSSQKFKHGTKSTENSKKGLKLPKIQTLDEKWMSFCQICISFMYLTVPRHSPPVHFTGTLISYTVRGLW